MPKSELPEWCWLLKGLLKEIEEEQEEGAARRKIIDNAGDRW